MSLRVRAANEISPLDDGARNGTEHWRDVAGVSFCHWARWLLRLAVAPSSTRSSRARADRDEPTRTWHPRVEGQLEARIKKLVGLVDKVLINDP